MLLRRCLTPLASFNQLRMVATVLKRVHQPPLLPRGSSQDQIDRAALELSKSDPKYLRYEVVQERDQEVPPVKIILLKSNEEYGVRGQIVTLPSDVALPELLLPGLAVYASPDNLEQYKSIVIPEDLVQYSSETVRKAIPNMSRMCVALIMSPKNQWTVEPWHVRLALRAAASLEVVTSEGSLPSIELPAHPIRGPGMNLEGKEFLAHLTVNGKERVAFRCAIFHGVDSEAAIADDDLELAGDEVIVEEKVVPPPAWRFTFKEPVFEEQREALYLLPRNQPTPEELARHPSLTAELPKYAEWKAYRDKKLFS